MARISGVGKGGRDDQRKTISSARSKKVTGKKQTFQAHLSRVSNEDIYNGLEELMEDIQSKGDRLAQEMTWESFIDYRDSVKEFIKLFVSKAYKVFGLKGRNRKGNQKLYLYVKTIDNKLEEIGENVIEGEQKRLNVISKIDELRGLLLDLYQ